MNIIHSKRFISLLVAVIILCSFLFATSCQTALVPDNGLFYCSKNKVTYKELDVQYSPVAISTEKYADLDENGVKTALFKVENIAPEKCLATEDGRMFTAVNEDVPSLTEMSVDRILVCKEGSNMTVTLSEISKEGDVNSILAQINDGNRLDYPTVGHAKEIYSLSMASSKFPWMYYNVSYIEFEEDVLVVDYVSDINAYVPKDVDENVKKTVTSVFDCWYLTEDPTVYEKVVHISEKTGIEYSTIRKPNGSGGVNDYVGLLFSEVTSLEECIEKVIELYDGDMTDEELRDFLGATDMTEHNSAIEYNYGKYLVYDKATGNCMQADGVLHGYVGSSEDE